MKRKLLWFMALSLVSLVVTTMIVNGRFSARAKPKSPQVPAQEGQTRRLPFKGWLDKEDAQVEVILKVYDQEKGGTMLFETKQAVVVTQGMYVTFVEVPSEIISKHPTVWLEAARVTAPDLALGERISFVAPTRTTQAFTCDFPNGCASLCSTCGGAYPHFRGSIPTRLGVAPFIRGLNCGGDIVPRNDVEPFLCTQ